MHTSTSRPRTHVELLRMRAEEQPGQRGYTYLADGDREEGALTYGELDRRARAIGATLQAMRLSGGRGLLLYPPGLDFIAGLLGCWYGGIVAVPAYPPDPARLGRTLPRLKRIAADAQATVVLTTSPISQAAGLMAADAPALAALPWVATDALTDDVASSWRDPGAEAETIAILQYTSGSTSDPKGVIVTHANFFHNSRLLARAFGQDHDDVQVNWLPLYHDMGLMGGVLQSLHLGVPSVLLSPVAFLKQPIRWLQAISRFGGKTSGGPNFAYDLCVDRTTPAQRDGLDLSTWSVAFNGAEPIRAATLDRFVATFAPYGFRRAAFYPCYGLAEATLIATGGPKSAPPVLLPVDRRALASNRVRAPESGTEPQLLVGCGSNVGNRALVIADPDSGRACPDDTVGEIWIAGECITQGYWGRREETERGCRVRLAGSGDGPFLRTGDLGFIHDGELFVTGRIKDVIIVNGENHYPQDIERTAQESHPALRRGCGAAFGVSGEKREELVIVNELDPAVTADPESVVAAICRAVAEEHGMRVDAVVLLEARTIPKTSSGKIQRYACRLGFLEGSLDVRHAWTIRGRHRRPLEAQAGAEPIATAGAR